MWPLLPIARKRRQQLLRHLDPGEDLVVLLGVAVDVGALDDGRVFYAIKLVQGKRLDQTAGDNASFYDLLRIFQKVCEAVAFAHARGVIHRDRSPKTLWLARLVKCW